MSFNFFCHNVPSNVGGGCTAWIETASSVALTDFWVSSSTVVAATFRDQMRLDRVATVNNDEIYVRVGSDMSITHDFGDNWSTVTQHSLIPVDTVWADGEKTSATFIYAAFPYGVPSTGFSMQDWKWKGGQLYACFYHSVGQASHQRSSLIANLSTNTIAQTGFNNTSVEAESLRELWSGAPYLPSCNRFTFTWWDGELTSIGQIYRYTPTDPFPYSKGLLKGAISQSNAVTLDNNSGGPVRMEVVSGNVLWYGDRQGGTDGYGIVKGDTQLGVPYSFTCYWQASPPYWRLLANATYQSTKAHPWATGGVWLTTRQQRPAKWLSQEWMFAFTGDDGLFYDSDTNYNSYDYSSHWYNSNWHIKQIIPVQDKGAFFSLEVSNSDLRTGKLRISATGEPGTYGDYVDFTLPVAASGSIKDATIYYSESQAQFLLVYYDTNSKIHIVTFDDVFTCSARE